MPAPTPPPNPYASAGSAVLAGASGTYTVRSGGDVLVGRDPAQCAIHLTEPRVSAVHARLKLEGGQLMVRDEASNNGVCVAGQRIPPGAWTPVPSGTALRFGPVEFAVRLEP